MQTMLTQDGRMSSEQSKSDDTFFTKIKENAMSIPVSINATVLTSLITSLLAITILSFTYYKTKQLMHVNIETAIAKGIDPVAVRCAYADSADNLCLVYSMSHRTPDAPSVGRK